MVKHGRHNVKRSKVSEMFLIPCADIESVQKSHGEQTKCFWFSQQEDISVKNVIPFIFTPFMFRMITSHFQHNIITSMKQSLTSQLACLLFALNRNDQFVKSRLTRRSDLQQHLKQTSPSQLRCCTISSFTDGNIKNSNENSDSTTGLISERKMFTETKYRFLQSKKKCFKGILRRIIQLSDYEVTKYETNPNNSYINVYFGN